MARDRFFYDVRQYALITRQQEENVEILALQLPAHCGDAAGKWTLPGGKLEPKDTPEGGLLREIAEETGLTATNLHLITAKRWTTDNSEKLALFYEATVAKSADILLSEEHKALCWVSGNAAANLHFYRPEVADVVADFLA